MLYKNASLFGKIADIETKNGRIIRVGRINQKAGIDLEGMKVFPGLIDTHIHGCIGSDTMDNVENDLEAMSDYLLRQGVTSWLPTTMTMDMETIKKAVSRRVSYGMGAEVLGYHMEGPYINKNRKGAQNEEFIKSPDFSDIEAIKKMPLVKMVTLAPELLGAAEFIEECGKIVSIGHTDADYKCAMKAFARGAKSLTHTFNAMPPLHHREPGPIGAAIDSDAYVEVICDGLHISPSVIKMLYRTFGPDRMVLISDAMRATGLCDGTYEFGGQTITVKDSVARTADGAIAGSTSTLLTCVKKAIEFGIPEKDAFKMASTTPAKLLGIRKGKIKPGYDADFIVVDDKYNAVLVVKSGIAKSVIDKRGAML